MLNSYDPANTPLNNMLLDIIILVSTSLIAAIMLTPLLASHIEGFAYIDLFWTVYIVAFVAGALMLAV